MGFLRVDYLGFRSDRLLPLVNYPEIRDEQVARGEKNGLLSKLFVLHQLNRYHFDKRPKVITKFDSIQTDGSMLYDMKNEKKVKFSKKDQQEIFAKKKDNNRLINRFEKFQAICTTHSIELICVFPPTYINSDPAFIGRFQKLVKGNTKIFHFDQSKYTDSNLFMDLHHLNKKGALQFSAEIIDLLSF